METHAPVRGRHCRPLVLARANTDGRQCQWQGQWRVCVRVWSATVRPCASYIVKFGLFELYYNIEFINSKMQMRACITTNMAKWLQIVEFCELKCNLITKMCSIPETCWSALYCMQFNIITITKCFQITFVIECGSWTFFNFVISWTFPNFFEL